MVSVVIANWNGRPYLEKCLPSLAAQTYPNVEIIVVDNGSADGSIRWIAEHYPSVRLIQNNENRGFAAANNQGIRQARGAYIALLNNDAWADANWLAELVGACERHPRIGMAASLMLFADQPHVINSSGVCVDRCGISWDRWAGRDANCAVGAPDDVFGPCAGAALYRREVFEDVGLFDEEFFAYLEDVDLAWRARWRGWRAVFVDSARVYHVHSATALEGSPLKTYLLAKNKLYMIAKNYPVPHLLTHLPLIVFYELLSLADAIWKGRGRSAWQGRLAGLGMMAAAWHKRRILWAKRRVSPGDVFRYLEPVAWPWSVYERYRHVRARLALQEG